MEKIPLEVLAIVRKSVITLEPESAGKLLDFMEALKVRWKKLRKAMV